MLVYHSDNKITATPGFSKQDKYLNYGDGFTTVCDREQAVKLARAKVSTSKIGIPIINMFTFDFEGFSSECNLCIFSEINEEWFKYIISCREGKSKMEEYDAIQGLLSNEVTSWMLTFYELGYVPIDVLVRGIPDKTLAAQWVFKTERAFKYLEYKGSEELCEIQ